MPEANAKFQAYNRDFVILFLIMLMTGAGNTALQSVLPNIGRTLGVADYQIAIIFSVSAVLWVFAAPVWARRSDNEGRKKMVLIGASGFTLSILMVGMFLWFGLNGWLSASVAMLCVLLSRIIYGLFGSAAPPAAQAMIALRTNRDDRIKALTLLGSAFGLGTIIGPAIAPLLILPGLGLAGPAIAFAFFGLMSWIAAYYFLDDDALDSPGEDARGANISYPSLGGAPAGASITAATSDRTTEPLGWTDTRIWPWILCGLVTGHAQAMSGQAMGFLVIDRLGLPIGQMSTQQLMALVFMSGAAAALLAQWGIIPNTKMKPRTMMIVGLILSVVGLIGTANATSLYGIAMTYSLSSIGFGFTRPAFTAGASLAVNRSLQGAVAGRVTSINGASYVLGPTIGIIMYEFTRPLPFIVSAVVLIALIPYALNQLKTAE